MYMGITLSIGLVLALSTISVSAQEPNGFQEFEKGSVSQNSLEQAKALVNESYMMSIKRSVDKNCDNSGNCSIASIETKQNGWRVSAGCGEGAVNASGGNNYYYGATPTMKTENGVNCYVGVAYENKTCTAQFKIPQVDFVNFIRYSLAQRVQGSEVEMGQLNPEYEFQKRLQLEFARTLQSACANK